MGRLSPTAPPIADSTLAARIIEQAALQAAIAQAPHAAILHASQWEGSCMDGFPCLRIIGMKDDEVLTFRIQKHALATHSMV